MSAKCPRCGEEMTINENKLVIITEGVPSNVPEKVTFKNYNEIRTYLQNGLEEYQNVIYADGDTSTAEKDQKALKKVKKKLDDLKKELKAGYSKPYVEVEAQLDELISMVKEPLDRIDEYITETKKKKKLQEILEYAAQKASGLGEFADKVLNSESFFNERWLNKTYADKTWHSDIDAIIAKAADDIRTIQTVGGSNKGAMLAHYFDKLSMDGMQEFQESLNDEKLASAEIGAVEDEDRVTGYKTLKIYGTQRQMLQIMSQLDLMGIDYEEIEDGMPSGMTEITQPSFDSFVAFDIEHTGTYGISNGDADPEIIEIGAVKVVNGVITERFDELANPGRKIVPRIARLTHITDEMVADKPPVDEIIKKFKDFVGDDILVGHNIKGCDIPHVTRAARRAGISFENSFLDTKPLAIKMRNEKGWNDVKLTTLSAYYVITQNEAHRAWCDAEANAHVYLAMKEGQE